MSIASPPDRLTDPHRRPRLRATAPRVSTYRRLFRCRDCSDLCRNRPTRQGIRHEKVGTIRGRQEERVGIPRAGSGTGSCSIDGSYSAWASNESDEHQAERLHAVVLGMVMCSVVHADVVRGGVSRGAGLFRPRARETRCRPGRSAFRSEQSQGRNNRRCSDIGTTPIQGAAAARDRTHFGRPGLLRRATDWRLVTPPAERSAARSGTPPAAFASSRSSKRAPLVGAPVDADLASCDSCVVVQV